jgi:hypothetical protein
LDYPNNFNVPAFPAGKTVAFARGVSVWTSIVFFLIIVVCGFLLLNIHLRKNFPFLISINPITEDWTVVAYPGEKEKPIPQYHYIQEKLVHDFVKDWFTISADMDLNEQVWEKCSVEECNNPEQFNPNNKICALSCKSSAPVFAEFEKKVLPNYRARIAEANEKWSISSRGSSKGILINQNMVSENSSKWQVYTIVNSSVFGNFSVLIFVDIEREIGKYPATFGYYINQFNAYRIVQ